MFFGELGDTLGVEHESLKVGDSLTLNLDINVNVKSRGARPCAPDAWSIYLKNAVN